TLASRLPAELAPRTSGCGSRMQARRQPRRQRQPSLLCDSRGMRIGDRLREPGLGRPWLWHPRNHHLRRLQLHHRQPALRVLDAPRVGHHLAVGAGLRYQRNLQLEQHGRRPGQGVLRGLGRRRPKSKNRRRVRGPPGDSDLTQRRRRGVAAGSRREVENRLLSSVPLVTSPRTSVSAVVPAYNSELSLPQLVSRLEPVLDAAATDYELLIVDDGSRDGTWSVIESLARDHKWVRGVHLMRNYGQHNAVL